MPCTFDAGTVVPVHFSFYRADVINGQVVRTLQSPAVVDVALVEPDGTPATALPIELSEGEWHVLIDTTGKPGKWRGTVDTDGGVEVTKKFSFIVL